MKLARLKHDPMALADFYERALAALGAACERTWHDRLLVVADGRAAHLWGGKEYLVETELRFVPAEATGVRDAQAEVFPGCPLTFRVAEMLRPEPLAIDRVALKPFGSRYELPPLDLAERLWRLEDPGIFRWRVEGGLQPGWHCSLLALVRVEVQAIEQHWTLHRVVISLPDGRRDEALAAALDLAAVDADPAVAVGWPSANPALWVRQIGAALQEEMAGELQDVQRRQQNYLRRELDRLEDYFDGYERELKSRQSRRVSDDVRARMAERLAAATAERERRRADQVSRHEVRMILHLDALTVLAEPAWQAVVGVARGGAWEQRPATLIPRLRRWIVSGT